MEIFPQVLITGVSGLVGSELAKRFASQGVAFSALLRRGRQPGVSGLLWDPYHFEFRDDMRRLNGTRAAIHLAGDNVGSGRWTPEKKRRIRDSRVQTTRSLVELLSRLDQRPEVLICASATGFYGDRAEQTLTEKSSSGEGFLAEVCQEWEAEAETAVKLGIRVVSLRFGVILAAKGGALAKMLPLFRVGMGGRLGDGQQWMSWISLPEVVRIVERCMADTQLHGPVNAVANPVTNREFTSVLAGHLHRPAVFPAPAFALRMAMGEMADATILASTRVIPEKLLQSGFVFEYPTLSQALGAVLPA